jgi:hypothetical protein
MQVWSGGAALLAALGLVACGKATSSGTDLRQAGTPAVLECTKTNWTCVASCADLDFAPIWPDCEDGEWTCPEGSVDYATCPPESCIRRESTCCSPLGVKDRPACTSDGLSGDCAEGWRAQSGDCIPEGLTISSCQELAEASPCASEELRCTATRCSRNCACEPTVEGDLEWHCHTELCKK